MKNKLDERVLRIADYIILTKDTIRKTAKHFKISKSTVHKDIRNNLKELDYNRYIIVNEIFENHIKTRHIKGGQSTKRKYEQLKLSSRG